MWVVVFYLSNWSPSVNIRVLQSATKQRSLEGQNCETKDARGNLHHVNLHPKP